MKKVHPSLALTMIALSCLSLNPSLSFAKRNGSSGVGKGGDVLILPNDEVILADFFIMETGVQTTLPEVVVEELRRVKFIFNQYAEAGSFVDEQILNPFVDYRVVAGIQMPCQRVELGDHPGVKALGGCSTGMTTYLDKNYLPKMTIRHFALLIVHERLRAKFPNIDDLDLKAITVGLDTALEVLGRQLNQSQRINTALRDGLSPQPLWDENKLEERSYRDLTQLRWHLFRLFRPNDQQALSNESIHRNGGGLIGRYAQVPETVTVTISSRIDAKAKKEHGSFAPTLCAIGDGSAIVATTIRSCSQYEIGENVLLDQVFIANQWEHGSHGRISDNSMIIRSDLGRFDKMKGLWFSLNFRVGAFSKIIDSTLQGNLMMKDRTSIIQGEYVRDLRDYKDVYLHLEEGASIENSEGDSIVALGKNAKLIGLKIESTRASLDVSKKSALASRRTIDVGVFLGDNTEVNGRDFDSNSATKMRMNGRTKTPEAMAFLRKAPASSITEVDLQAKKDEVSVLLFAENTSFDLTRGICTDKEKELTVDDFTRIENTNDLFKLCKKSKHKN